MSKSDIKVGIFVLLGLVLSGLVIFLIGDERRLFEPAGEFKAVFEDVQGLKKGAPIRMGGVRIGQVVSVEYADDASDTRVYVMLSIVSENAKRIRSDSLARVEGKGFLGDKMITIDKGKAGDFLAPGDTIRTEEPADLFGRLDKMAGKAEATMDNVGNLTESLADQRLHKDIRESAHSVNVLLKQITEGQGYPHRFLTDPDEAERISRTIKSLDRTSAELAMTMRELRLAVRQVRTGPGFAHEMLYGDGASKELAQFGGAAEEVGVTLRAIREGDGFAKELLFGGGDANSQKAMSNVNRMTGDLADIVRGMKQGKGTIGALLVDPSIYEDVKRVLGNVERNNVLRALVRYSIKQDQTPPQVEVAEKVEK